MRNAQRLQRSTPAAQGIAADAILAFVEAVERAGYGLHSLMLLRHGAVVAEGWWQPYQPDRPHTLFSLSKSFTSTAIGLAVAEGRLSIDDLVLAFFPDDAPAEVSANLAAIRVHDLLAMATGHAENIDMAGALGGTWVRAALAAPVVFAPGTHFFYNNAATYLLSAIIQKLVGTTLLDYLQPRLFAPLGIANPTWEQSPQGINTGAWGLSITTEDIACFGQLYVQRGMWHGTQLVPEAWVAQATRFQVSNAHPKDSDWQQGYGYQFWRCQHNAYRGDGAFGQYCIVMPDQDAVLAITSGISGMQGVLDLVWEHLLPAMRPRPMPPPIYEMQTQLDQQLTQLAIEPPHGQTTSPLAAQVSEQTYTFDAANHMLETARLDFDAAGCTLSVRDERGEHHVAVGSDVWRESTTTLDAHGPLRAAAWGAWTAEDTFTIKICYVETPFIATLTCRFSKDRLALDYQANVGFGPTALPQQVGRAA